MTRQLTSLTGFALVSVLLTPSLFAAPVTWTVDADGGILDVIGTFDYDPDTDEFSNVNVTTESSIDIFNNFQVESFSSSNVFFSSFLTMEGADGNSEIRLRFDPRLDTALNEGSTVVQLDYLDSYYTNYLPDDTYTDNLSGSVTASVVPIPAAAWLFCSALAGLGWLRRRQTV